ncbi:MAG: Holliday junction branch migration DNA helicase RuvB [Phycisphaerales bacterium]|nr:Holliday junction branch migration DNA helicase RuvB [Phycisphaerales bacterium]
MAKDRIVAGQKQEADPEQTGSALRPRMLVDYIGQARLKERLSIALQAVRGRGEPMEHVLLHGPPGLGKTTLAHVIAGEMGTHAFVTSGPALTKAGDLVGLLTKLEARDVLFIDEIHRLPPAVEEYIYPAMEDCQIDFTVDSGMHAKTVTIGLQPFTLIGATTRPGMLTHALRTRFGLSHHISFYPESEIELILQRAAGLMGVIKIKSDSLAALASRSRGTPRVALRLLRRVRDFAAVRADGQFGPGVIADAMELEGVDSLGLDELDRSYLRVIATTYGGGPVGLEAIAATLGEDGGTLEDVVEPYLLQVGFLARTRQGRCLTQAAAEHVGLPWREPQQPSEALFG